MSSKLISTGWFTVQKTIKIKIYLKFNIITKTYIYNVHKTYITTYIIEPPKVCSTFKLYNSKNIYKN